MFINKKSLLSNSFLSPSIVTGSLISDDSGNFIAYKEKGNSDINFYDIVYLNDIDNKVYKFNDNKIDKDVFGIVTGHDKINNDFLKVLIMGIIELPFMEFNINKNIFLNEKGYICQYRPKGGYLHYLGKALDKNIILFKSNYEKIRQNPF